MTRIRELKTTFTAGEVSQELLGREVVAGRLTASSAARQIVNEYTGRHSGGVT